MGLEHSGTAEIIYDIAVFQEAQGHQQEALSSYRRAFAIREHALGQEHPKTQDTQQRFVTLLQTLEQGGILPLLERAPSERGEQTT
jgi:hypothetical protein